MTEQSPEAEEYEPVERADGVDPESAVDVVEQAAEEDRRTGDLGVDAARPEPVDADERIESDGYESDDEVPGAR